MIIGLHKIKHWSMCLLGYPMSKSLATVNTVCSLVAVACFVVFRFYFLERYQLYSCRRNYRTGFPAKCHGAPLKGMDVDCAVCIMTGLISALSGRIVTILSIHPHWQCRIAHRTKEKLKQLDLYSPKLFSLLCRLQGIHGKSCDCKPKKEMHTVRYISCVPLEIYVSLKLRRWARFMMLMTLLCLAVLLPFSLLVVEPHAIQVTLGLLTFLCFPIVALGMLAVSAPFFSATRDIVFLTLLGTWGLLFMICLLISWIMEQADEKILAKKNFADRLEHIGLRRQDAEICITMLNKKLTGTEKMLANDLSKRIDRLPS